MRQLTKKETEDFERLPDHMKKRVEDLMAEKPDLSMTELLELATEFYSELRQEDEAAENLEAVSTGEQSKMPITILGRKARKLSVGTDAIFKAVGHPFGTGQKREITVLEVAAILYVLVTPDLLALIKLAKNKEKFYDAVTLFAFDLEVDVILAEFDRIYKSLPDDDGGDEDDEPNPTGR